MGSLAGDLSIGSELRQTHISWAFLRGDRVYKVKKPVDLGFLDYRALEARRRFCEAEVELNRRLAPEVYLGVLPVTRDASGRHRIDGEGEVVDWAVEMVRQPDHRRADVLLAARQLGLEEIDRIAVCLARFHERCRRDAAIDAFGRPEAIARNVRENFQQTRAMVHAYVQPAEATEIETRQLAFLSDRAPLLEERIAAGRVRDGHGDLRLEHVYLDVEVPGEVTVLDCIEFNERFRYADVAADLAFLSMDLAAHGRVDLAERVVARYAMESNDYQLYRVIDFYEGYRAYVRAKIAAFVAAAPDTSPEVAARAAAEARRHFLLALAVVRPPLIPASVIAVGGAIASGKTTTADRIAGSTGTPVIEADRTRKWMLGMRPTDPAGERPWHGAYDPAFTERVYAEMLERARAVLASGRPVILDASFRSRSMRAAARELARGAGVSFRFVECRADRDTCLARLARRATSPEHGASDAGPEIYDAFAARMEPVDELEPGEHVVVDTRAPIGELAERLPAA